MVDLSFGLCVTAPFARASFRNPNGVLTVTLPKTAQQQRTRRIQVQRGGEAGSRSGGQMIQGEATNIGDQQHQQGGTGREAGQMGGSKGDRQQS